MFDFYFLLNNTAIAAVSLKFCIEVQTNGVGT